MSGMRRRQFISLLGGAVAAWPVVARAQQPAMPVIGFMSTRSPEDSAYLLAAFRRGLAEGGFVEGQNVAIEFRWARGRYDLLSAMAAELVSRRVAVLTTAGGEPSPRSRRSGQHRLSLSCSESAAIRSHSAWSRVSVVLAVMRRALPC